MSKGPLSIREQLAGKRLLVVGGTGFLGKVWLSMLLSRFPEVEHIYLVVRQRFNRDGSLRLDSETRYWSEIASSPVFDPIREDHGGASFDTLFSLREPKAIKLRGRWSSDRSLLRYRKASLAQNEANKVPLGVRQLSRIIAANPAKHFDDLTQSRQQLSGLRASRTR